MKELGKIWGGIILIASVYAIIMGRVELLLDGILSIPDESFAFLLIVISSTVFWTGFMYIFKEVGIIDFISLAIKPLFRKIMPNLKDQEAIEYLSMNIAANMFGLGFAATPSGLKGIKRLKELGRTNEKAQEAANKIARQAARTQLDLEKQLSKSILELRQASLEKDLELSRLRFSWERQELENKLKYDKTLTAESREAINQLILNMEERRYKEESEIRQRWSDKEFEEEARNAENRIKMRIKVQEEMDKLSLAQVKNRNYAGLIGDDKDARIKAQQAVANEELRIAQSKYDAISQMDEEQWSAQYGSIQAYEMARLDAENNVQDAIKKTTDLSIASQNQAIKVQLDELAAASSLVGSLRGLFGALGDDLEAFAIAEQALAVTQIIIDAQKATMEAMVASFQLGPIAGPIWFATQKGIITAQAAIASATTLAQAIPSFFSEGGLVTGPGTGTSDSIPAMLSNGEAVMTAQAVNDWGAMLSAMNVASGGNAIQVSNLPQRNDGMRGMKAMIREAMLEMPAPRVAVVDIIKGEKRVKVQNSLGKLGRKKYE